MPRTPLPRVLPAPHSTQLAGRSHPARCKVLRAAAAAACRRDIDKILALLPPRETRQTVLFSATFPADTSSLVRSRLSHKTRVTPSAAPVAWPLACPSRVAAQCSHALRWAKAGCWALNFET